MKQLRRNRLGLLCLSFLLCLGIGIKVNSAKEINMVKATAITGTFSKYTSSTSGSIDEGDYIIIYTITTDTKSTTYAMKNEIIISNNKSANRLSYSTITGTDSTINDPDDSIVWHIASSGHYVTIYNANIKKYVAGNGIKNQAQLLEDGTDNKSLWAISGKETFEFVNKYNSTLTSPVNSNLRNNANNGFACYSTSTGGALTLYKKEASGPTIDAFTVTPGTTAFKSGETLSLNNLTISGTYSDNTSINITNVNDSRLSFKLGDKDLDLANLPTLTKSDSGKTVTITYKDDNGQSASGCYTITVGDGDVTSISIIDPTDTLTLPFSGEYTFKAKVEGNEPNEGVTWSIKEEDATKSIIDEETGEFLADEVNETITVVATSIGTDANGNHLTAERVVKVTGERTLTLDKTEISGWTGDTETYEINASTINVGESATYEWTSTDSDEQVIELDTEETLAIVSFKDAGTATITLTIKEDGQEDLTATCEVSVFQSALTNITLDKTEGSAYIGKSVTFNATTTKVGLATEELTYTSSNEEVATVTQNDKEFTVTAVKEGSATITISSVYTNTTKAEFIFTSLVDSVTSLSWTSRGDHKIYKSDTLKDFPNYSSWKFSPSWLDKERADNPVVGTGEDDIHLGLYDSSTPDKENETPLSLDYQFTLADNDKYLVAFYHGVNSVQNKQIEVANWREVVETTESTILTDNFAKAIGTKDSYGMPHNQISWEQCFNYDSKVITNISAVNVYTKCYESQSMLRLGTSNDNGSLTLETSSSMKIKSLTIGLAGWNGATSYSVKVSDGSSQSFTISEASNEKTFTTATNKLVIESINKDRTCITSLTINGVNETDISKTEDCLGLETFIDSYMHIGDIAFTDNSETGKCLGDSGYYALAKAAFNVLNEQQRTLFCTNEAYNNECARLVAWATANNEKVLDDYTFGVSTSGTNKINKINDKSSITIITLISLIGVVWFTSILLFKRKKETN